MTHEQFLAGMRFAHLDDFLDDPAVCADFADLMETAEEYVHGFGVTRQRHNQKRYDQVVRLLASHWYDNRDAISAGQAVDTPMGLRQLINQLKLTPSVAD